MTEDFFSISKVSDFLSLLGEHFGTLNLAWKEMTFSYDDTGNPGVLQRGGLKKGV